MTRVFISSLLLAAVALLSACRSTSEEVAILMERHHRAFDRAPEEPLRSGDPDAAKPDNEGSSEIEPAKPALPTDRLTLGQATTIALRDNPDIHAARARLAQATARIALARSRVETIVSAAPGPSLPHTWRPDATAVRLAPNSSAMGLRKYPKE